MRRARLLPLVLGLLAAGACSVSSAHDFDFSGTSPGGSGTAEIEALGRRFSEAYERGDLAAMVSLYTPDAVIFPGNSEAIRGREAIERYWRLPPGSRVTRHRSTPTEIRIDGDHAYDHGVYEISGERNGEAWGPTRGKYLIVWRREPEGWRMHLDMWNSRPG